MRREQPTIHQQLKVPRGPLLVGIEEYEIKRLEAAAWYGLERLERVAHSQFDARSDARRFEMPPRDFGAALVALQAQ